VNTQSRRTRHRRGRFAPVLGLLVATLVAVLLGAGWTSPAEAASRPAQAQAQAEDDVVLLFYWRDGCPNCEAQWEFLRELVEQRPTVRVDDRQVASSLRHAEELRALSDERGLTGYSVPTTLLQDRVWVGWNDGVRADLERAVDAALAGEPVAPGTYGRAGEDTCDAEEFCAAPERPTVDVPVLGPVDVGSSSLVVSTLVIGFVDGINPCSLWVLSVLMAIVLRTGSRARVVAVGTTFLLVTAAMYGVFIFALFSVLNFAALAYGSWIRYGVAGLAVGFGVVNVKDYFFYRRGVSLGIRSASKPGIYRRAREAAGKDSLPAVLAAPVVLALGVSFLETPCTIGLPALWTGLLQDAGVSGVGAAALFVVYLVPFLLDEFVIFGAAVVTMRAAKLQERHGRMLKLVSGSVLLALGGTLLVRPAVMEDVVGAVAVFAGAGLVAWITHQAWSRRVAEQERVPA
jgi:cytochrome c biogenesis protein CcdA